MLPFNYGYHHEKNKKLKEKNVKILYDIIICDSNQMHSKVFCFLNVSHFHQQSASEFCGGPESSTHCDWSKHMQTNETQSVKENMFTNLKTHNNIVHCKHRQHQTKQRRKQYTETMEDAEEKKQNYFKLENEDKASLKKKKKILHDLMIHLINKPEYTTFVAHTVDRSNIYYCTLYTFVSHRATISKNHVIRLFRT